MKFSQRLWWSIAHNADSEDLDECMVWAKVRTQCAGKRHYLREIDLTPSQEEAVFRILSRVDERLKGQIQHEHDNFPDGRARMHRVVGGTQG